MSSSDASSSSTAIAPTTPLAKRVTRIPERAGRWVKGSCIEFKTTFVSWVKDWGLEDYADLLSLITAIGYVLVDSVDLANISETTVNRMYALLAAMYLVDSLIYWYDFEKEVPKDEKYRRWAQVSEWTNVFGSLLYFVQALLPLTNSTETIWDISRGIDNTAVVFVFISAVTRFRFCHLASNKGCCQPKDLEFWSNLLVTWAGFTYICSSALGTDMLDTIGSLLHYNGCVDSDGHYTTSASTCFRSALSSRWYIMRSLALNADVLYLVAIVLIMLRNYLAHRHTLRQEALLAGHRDADDEDRAIADAAADAKDNDTSSGRLLDTSNTSTASSSTLAAGDQSNHTAPTARSGENQPLLASHS